MAIIRNNDANRLLQGLSTRGFQATKMASTGGFLGEGNTTMLIGVEAAKVDEVLGIIGELCNTRQRLTPLTSFVGAGEEQIPFPVEVPHGGAVVFVLNVEGYAKF